MNTMFPILWSWTLRDELPLDYGVSGIPEKFFIDETGALQRSFVGPMSPEALRSILNDMLAAP